MNKVARVSAAMLASTVALPTTASATILTFDVQGGVTNFKPLVQTYGDNVTTSPDGNGHSYGFGAEGATPNVAVSYGTSGEAPSLWTTGYGDLSNIYFNDADGDTTLTILFSAATNYVADLYGFDLASFLTGGQTIQGFKVRDVGAGTDLFSQGPTLISGTTHNSFAFATPLSANQLEIVIDLTGLGGVSDDIGIDNIRFGQTFVDPGTPGAIPEPATWAMLIGGFGLVGGAMRRRSRRVLAVAA